VIQHTITGQNHSSNAGDIHVDSGPSHLVDVSVVFTMIGGVLLPP
jgi:hypothetical protein